MSFVIGVTSLENRAEVPVVSLAPANDEAKLGHKVSMTRKNLVSIDRSLPYSYGKSLLEKTYRVNATVVESYESREKWSDPLDIALEGVVRVKIKRPKTESSSSWKMIYSTSPTSIRREETVPIDEALKSPNYFQALCDGCIFERKSADELAVSLDTPKVVVQRDIERIRNTFSQGEPFLDKFLSIILGPS